MLYVIDTDILSMIEHQSGSSVPLLFQRVSNQKPEELCTTIITFHEQAKGSMAAVNSAKTEASLLRAYELMETIRDVLCQLRILPFEGKAKRQYDLLVRQRIRGGTMDLRIAAITLVNNATLVTRNVRDFERIPGLKIEDWTV